MFAADWRVDVPEDEGAVYEESEQEVAGGEERHNRDGRTQLSSQKRPREERTEAGAGIAKRSAMIRGLARLDHRQ